jgi:hypothetical protein
VTLDVLCLFHKRQGHRAEQQVRDLGGVPPEPGRRPGELPRDASDIAVLGDNGAAVRVRALADDHEALADAYREALALPGDDDETRHMLELFASEMEQHGARLAALLPAVQLAYSAADRRSSSRPASSMIGTPSLVAEARLASPVFSPARR